MAKDTCFIYTTVGNEETARVLAAQLVEERLAACVTIISPVQSVYRWQGAVVSSMELVLLCKTLRERAPTLMHRLEALHPYEVPAIIELPVAAVNACFAQWVATEVCVEAGN